MWFRSVAASPRCDATPSRCEDPTPTTSGPSTCHATRPQRAVPRRSVNDTDEFTCKALVTNATRRIAAAGTLAVQDEVMAARRVAPRVLRVDNEPEVIADALQDWCELTEIKTSFCDPESAWWNGRIESLNSRLQDELGSRWIFLLPHVKSSGKPDSLPHLKPPAGGTD